MPFQFDQPIRAGVHQQSQKARLCALAHANAPALAGSLASRSTAKFKPTACCRSEVMRQSLEAAAATAAAEAATAKVARIFERLSCCSIFSAQAQESNSNGHFKFINLFIFPLARCANCRLALKGVRARAGLPKQNFQDTYAIGPPNHLSAPCYCCPVDTAAATHNCRYRCPSLPVAATAHCYHHCPLLLLPLPLAVRRYFCCPSLTDDAAAARWRCRCPLMPLPDAAAAR